MVNSMRYLLKIISFILFIGILLSFSVNRGSNPNKDRLLLELISYVLERGHYNPRQIDDNFSKNVFNSYIKGVDNQRRFFLQSDIDNFTKYVQKGSISRFVVRYEIYKMQLKVPGVIVDIGVGREPISTVVLQGFISLK